MAEGPWFVSQPGRAAGEQLVARGERELHGEQLELRAAEGRSVEVVGGGCEGSVRGAQGEGVGEALFE